MIKKLFRKMQTVEPPFPLAFERPLLDDLCDKLKLTLLTSGVICKELSKGSGEGSPIPCKIFEKTLVSYLLCNNIPFSQSKLEGELENLPNLDCDNLLEDLAYVISNYTLCTGEAAPSLPPCKKWKKDVLKLLNCIPAKEYPELTKILNAAGEYIPVEEKPPTSSKLLPMFLLPIPTLVIFVLVRRR